MKLILHVPQIFSREHRVDHGAFNRFVAKKDLQITNVGPVLKTDIVEIGEGTSQKIGTTLVFLMLTAYPIYLFIRLIARAIKILKER